ncbi:SRR1-like protein isoform X1 [Cephus cinctus]|uniref:SRR1-like protein isoform X1 n=1 Tax=Cephus cinctus TaxID=211228 RepID=A0AAJ7VZU8_CEPCN|nr:SRR1-like protein isoform X1 [Cephus cinctus]
MSGAFQLVTRRRGGRRILSNFHRIGKLDIENPEIDTEAVLSKVRSTVDEIAVSPYMKVVLDGLNKSLAILDIQEISEILCYGLGNFSEHSSPKYQLALVLALKELYGANVSLYDPIFYSKEIEILRSLGLQVILSNEEGKRCIGDKFTIVYMPHCAKQLTNNFLFANWSALQLNNCLVWSNSFSDLVEDHFKHNLEHSANYIFRIAPYITEITLDNNFEFLRAFSGAALHIFTKGKLGTVPEGFWESNPEPIYSDQDLEFLTRERLEQLQLSN